MSLLPVFLGLLGCEQPGTSGQTGEVTVDLRAPISGDPLAGVDALRVRVFNGSSVVVAEASGPPDAAVAMPSLDTLGVVEVEVVGLAGDTVLSAGRSGPFVVGPGEDTALDVLFLPVNVAHPLDAAILDARSAPASFLAADGRVLLVGGRAPSSGSALDTTEWFDPFEGFATGPFDLDGPRQDLMVTSFGDHGALLAGGRTGASGAEASDVLWLDARGALEVAMPDMAGARADGCLAQVTDTTAVALGGRGPDDHSVEVLRPRTEGAGHAWTPYVLDSDDVSVFDRCVGTGSGLVALINHDTSGWGVLDLASPSVTDIAERFDQVAGPRALDGAGLIPRGDDRVLVFGGLDGTRARGEFYAFDVAARQVDDSGLSLEHPRADAQWRPWRGDDHVVIALGVDGVGNDVMSMELLDLALGGVLDVELPVRDAAMEVLPDGSVVFLGGTRGGEPASAHVVVPWFE